MNFLLVFLGGGIGSLLRYLIGLGFLKTSISLPLATFAANVAACVIFAITLWAVSAKHLLNQSAGTADLNIRLLIITGFCGGLSTFSTFSYETFLMLKQGMYLFAFLNIIFSVVICLLVFYLFNKQTI